MYLGTITNPPGRHPYTLGQAGTTGHVAHCDPARRLQIQEPRMALAQRLWKAMSRHYQKNVAGRVSPASP